jgi:PAS domain S-box-containing protein
MWPRALALTLWWLGWACVAAPQGRALGGGDPASVPVLVVWTQGIAHALIAPSCLVILAALVRFVSSTRSGLATASGIVAVGVFLVASAAAAVAEIVGLWEPVSLASAVLTGVAAVAAVVAAATVVRVLPRARAFMAAARLSDERRLELEALRAILERRVEDSSRDLAVASDTVRRAEARFHHVVESAPSAIIITDRQRRILYVNRGAEMLFGYEREALLDQSLDMLVPDRFRGAHAGHVAEFFAEPKARAMGAGRDLFGRRRDGTDVPIEIGLTPIETADGPCTLASIVDITSRVRADALFRLVVEAVPCAIVMVGHDGRIQLINQKTEDLFGYERDELVGAGIDRLLPERHQAGHGAQVERFFAAGDARPLGVGGELYGRRKDGSEVPIEIGLNLIETPTGPATLASIIDITERKRSIDDLRRSNADLEQFANIASHDLQEPLRMVASYTELLAERYQGHIDERADKYIRYAVDGARRMQRLVADLLAYSRVGSQGHALVPVDTAQLVARVVESFEGTIRATGAEISVGTLPLVLADELQLMEVFQNLIGNALKFRSSAPPRIAIAAVPGDQCWVFSVSDNGIGLEMQYAERIFQMFQRLHETVRRALDR